MADLFQTQGGLQWGAVAAYAVAHGCFLASLLAGRRRFTVAAFRATGIAAVLHFATLAFAAAATGELLPAGFSGMATAVTFVLIGIYLAVDRRRTLTGVGLVATCLAFVTLLAAAAARRPQLEDPAFTGLWFRLHVLALLVSYGAFAAAFSTAAVYLIQERLLKHKVLASLAGRLPSLGTLDLLTHRLVLAAFPLLTVGLAAGAIWAGEIWDRAWSWEPKQTLALLTWLVYACYMGVRSIGGWKGRQLIVLNVVGFLFLLATFLGVSMLLPGRHKFI